MRKSFQNRKNLLMRHEQLKDMKKRSSGSDDRKRAGKLSSRGSPPGVCRDFLQVETAGCYDGRLTSGSDSDDVYSPGGLVPTFLFIIVLSKMALCRLL